MSRFLPAAPAADLDFPPQSPGLTLLVACCAAAWHSVIMTRATPGVAAAATDPADPATDPEAPGGHAPKEMNYERRRTEQAARANRRPARHGRKKTARQLLHTRAANAEPVL